MTPASSNPPAVGYGLWKVPNADAARMTYESLARGYRHLDCAADYGNEAEVGQGVAQALADGIIRRDELWITSKLWNTYHRREHVRQACERSLRDLNVDYLDLYLIHFPIALEFVPFETRYPAGWIFDEKEERPCMKAARVPIAETWSAMEELVRAGLVRHIGVANFGVSLLRDLLNYAAIVPTLLQVELHPYLTQDKLLRFCRESNIAVTAFSPLGAPSYVPLGMAGPHENAMEESVVVEAARRHHKSPAQVLLRWGVQRGTSVIPKTSNTDRLAENLDIFDFELSESEMTAISSLDRNRRFNDPGVFCEAAFGTFFPIYE